MLAAMPLVAGGCVERYFRVDTDPIGARVYINGADAGVAPVEVPFVHYGTLRVDCWLEPPPGDPKHQEQRPGATRFVALDPPWYERFPFELFAELLDPVTHVDRHAVTVAIPPAGEGDLEPLRRAAEELRAESR